MKNGWFYLLGSPQLEDTANFVYFTFKWPWVPEIFAFYGRICLNAPDMYLYWESIVV